jgi:hypothetical protein
MLCSDPREESEVLSATCVHRSEAFAAQAAPVATGIQGLHLEGRLMLHKPAVLHSVAKACGRESRSGRLDCTPSCADNRRSWLCNNLPVPTLLHGLVAEAGDDSLAVQCERMDVGGRQAGQSCGRNLAQRGLVHQANSCRPVAAKPREEVRSEALAHHKPNCGLGRRERHDH